MLLSQNSTNNTYKVILAGPHNAGKTMFLWRWQAKNFEFDGKPTIGADFVCKEVIRNGTKYKIHMWDTAGQEAYHSITAPYFRSCAAILLLFDLSDRKSFDNLDYWLELIKENTNSLPIIYLIGNKCDVEQCAVNDNELEEYATNNNLKFYKASAKENIKINTITEDLVDEIIAQSAANRPATDTILQPKKNKKSVDGCC